MGRTNLEQQIDELNVEFSKKQDSLSDRQMDVVLASNLPENQQNDIVNDIFSLNGFWTTFSSEHMKLNQNKGYYPTFRKVMIENFGTPTPRQAEFQIPSDDFGDDFKNMFGEPKKHSDSGLGFSPKNIDMSRENKMKQEQERLEQERLEQERLEQERKEDQLKKQKELEEKQRREREHELQREQQRKNEELRLREEQKQRDEQRQREEMKKKEEQRQREIQEQREREAEEQRRQKQIQEQWEREQEQQKQKDMQEKREIEAEEQKRKIQQQEIHEERIRNQEEQRRKEEKARKDRENEEHQRFLENERQKNIKGEQQRFLGNEGQNNIKGEQQLHIQKRDGRGDQPQLISEVKEIDNYKRSNQGQNEDIPFQGTLSHTKSPVGNQGMIPPPKSIYASHQQKEGSDFYDKKRSDKSGFGKERSGKES